MPFRWKILQATRVEGQNDSNFEKVKVTSDEFSAYAKINTINLSPEIKPVIESEEIIQGSYLMIDQQGRFYDSSNKKHNYSSRILEVGIENALLQVSTDTEKFKAR